MVKIEISSTQRETRTIQASDYATTIHPESTTTLNAFGALPGQYQYIIESNKYPRYERGCVQTNTNHQIRLHAVT